jgi:hypothetical protein
MTKIALVLLLGASHAHAAFDGTFKGPVVAEIYYEVRGACRMGETQDGKVLSEKEHNKQCYILDALGEQLKRNGYCWDNPEQEWIVCD